MPPQGGRTARQRLVSNENDENSNSTRLTRAKAAALNVDELAVPNKPLQSKKSNASAAQPLVRKRNALGDVSNVTKVDANDGKKVAGKINITKAAQPTGVTKNASRPVSRTALSSKVENKKVEVKRSGPGAIGATVQKRKVAASTSATVKEELSIELEEPVRKKAHHDVPEKTIKANVNEEDDVFVTKAEAKNENEEFVYPPGVSNLEKEDYDDPLMVAEYANEIFEYLRDLECHSVPNPNYMEHQDDLEWKTRGILIDWLIEVHTRFHLLPETLFLAVNIIDRFLSQKVVQLDRLQLVGVTAMFIASKYEEVLSPHIANFKHVADDGFSEAEILSAERFVLGTLNYDLSYPNPMNFLRRISKADNYDIQTRTIGKYLMEISLLDHRFMPYRPSHVAAASMYLARLILDRGEWDATIAFYAGYTAEEIEPVVDLMVDYLARPVCHEAFFKKYASKKFMKASIMTRQWAKKHAEYFGVEDPEIPLDQLEES